MMTGKHRIVVSAENNPYMAWQSKLFYFSCVTRLHHQPVIIVHERGQDWHPDFYVLRKAGCAISPAPNYRFSGTGDDYSCRNHPGTLIQAAELFAGEDLYIVLCDPDMIFTRAAEFSENLTGEFSSFINYASDFVSDAVRRLGIDPESLDLAKDSLRCSVPYVIPSAHALELGSTWLDAIDAFNPRRWEDVMYAFGLATLKLGLKLDVTHLADTNYWPDDMVRAPIIHYAYGDERWSKRRYFKNAQVPAVWYPQVKAVHGTIMDELMSQLRQARDFYSDPYFSNCYSARAT